MKRLFLISVTVCFGIMVTLLILNYRRPDSRADRDLAAREPDKAAAYWQSVAGTARTSRPYEKLALCYIAARDLKEARKWTVAGLTKFPGCVNLTFNLAFIEYHDKQYRQSLRLLDEVLRANDCYPNAHYLKGLAFEALGDVNAAKGEYVAEVNNYPASARAWEKLKGLRE